MSALGDVSRTVDGFVRVPVPSERQVTFSSSGRYTVYYEGAGADDSEVVAPALQISLEAVPDASRVMLQPYRGSATYSFGRHRGRALQTFRIHRPGSYTIRVADGSHAGDDHVAIGRGIGGAIARAVFPPLALGFGGAVLGAGVAIATGVRRQRARRAAAGAASAP